MPKPLRLLELGLGIGIGIEIVLRHKKRDQPTRTWAHLMEEAEWAGNGPGTGRELTYLRAMQSQLKLSPGRALQEVGSGVVEP